MLQFYVTDRNVIKILKGDITTMSVDAIVNAANTTLLGGGGVDGAIHSAAGPELRKECQLIGGCPTGEAKLTHGYRLKSPRIIHTVGPVWLGGSSGEKQMLQNCYRNCLTPAEDNKLGNIAFPAISTGAYHFPEALAAAIATCITKRQLQTSKFVQSVIFVCFDQDTYEAYHAALSPT